MYSLASQASLVALGECEAALGSLEKRSRGAIATLAAHLAGRSVADLRALRDSLYDLDDELEDLLSAKLGPLSVAGLQSGAHDAAATKAQLQRRADVLAHLLREALVNPVFPNDKEEEDDEKEDDEGSQKANAGETAEGGDALSTDGGDEAKEEGGDGAGGGDKAGHAGAAYTPTAKVMADKTKAPVSAPPAAKVMADKTKAPVSAPPATDDDEEEEEEEEETGGASAEEPAAAATEVVPPKSFSRQYSALSAERLVLLEDIQHRVDVISSEYEGLVSLLAGVDPSTEEGAATRLKVKTECTSLYGNLEKLQVKEIDSVLVGDLTSGQDDARAARKRLTRDVSALTERVWATVEEIKKAIALRP